MSSLYVYTTEGTCIYPEGGSDDASINRYFESVNFVADVRDQTNPSIEAYFRAILPSGRPEQLFLRFQGDDPASLFEDCRTAVLEELVSANDWEIQKTNNSSDPSMVFQRAVLHPATDPSRVFDDTPLAGRLDLLRSAVHSTRDPFTVAGRNYETIGDAIQALGDESVVMAVADEQISLSGVGIVFNQESQQYDLALPRDSEQLLQQVSTQEESQREQMAEPEEQRIESELSAIETQLQAIREKNVSQATVREQLDNVVSNAYPSLSVSSESARSVLSTDRSSDDSDTETSTSMPTPSSGGRFSGVFPNVPDGVAIGAVVGIGVIVLLLVFFVGLPGGSDADDSPGQTEFGVDFVNTPEEVTAGESLSVTVEVESVGNSTPEQGQTLEVDARQLGNDSATLDFSGDATQKSKDFSFETSEIEPGTNITVTASIGNANETTTVSVVSADGDNNGQSSSQADAEISDLDIADQGNSATVTAGDEAAVEVTVENVGDGAGSFDVTLTIGEGDGKMQKTNELASGETDTVTFEDVTVGLDPEDYEVTVSAGDAEANGTLTVEQVNFGANIISAPESVAAGNLVQVEVELTDVSGRIGEIQVDVTADFGGTTLTFDSLESGQSEFATISTEGTSPGDYTVKITPSGDEDNVLAETDVEITDSE